MTDAYIFMGSNIERETNYPEAVKRLRALGTIVAVSPVYETPAIRPDGAGEDAAGETLPKFYNGAVRLDTELSPHALRNKLREMERGMGRVRTADKFAPRTIDLDLVLYGEAVIDDGELRLPDPYLFERPFMTRALAHVNPDYVVPPDGPTLGELACRVRGTRGEMVEIPEASEQVQQWVRTPVKERVNMSEYKAMNSHGFGPGSWEANDAERDASSLLSSFRVAPPDDAARQAIEEAVRTILLNVGEDPTREGLLKTPERVARAYDELLAGYHVDPVAMINDALFETEYQDMVVVKDIEFFSMCEHHMLPFFGKVHVAYIPDGKVLGLSKIPRIVEMYARRLQLQEKMTHEIADFIQDLLHPRGVAVIVTGQHMCSMMRGVNKPDAKMVTQVMYGDFDTRDIRDQLNDRLREGN